jgi:hypothetical protein
MAASTAVTPSHVGAFISHPSDRRQRMALKSGFLVRIYVNGGTELALWG